MADEQISQSDPIFTKISLLDQVGCEIFDLVQLTDFDDEEAVLLCPRCRSARWKFAPCLYIVLPRQSSIVAFQNLEGCVAFPIKPPKIMHRFCIILQSPTVCIVAIAASSARPDLFALVLLVFIKSVHKLFLVQQFSPAPWFLVAEFLKLLPIRRIFPHWPVLPCNKKFQRRRRYIGTGGFGETGGAAWAFAEEEYWGCETGDCTLPETGSDAEDAMRDCNFRSLSRIFLNHHIFLRLVLLQKAPDREQSFSLHHQDTCSCSEDKFHSLCLYIVPLSPCTVRARLAPLL